MSNIQFILSSEKPWDTTYRTQEGQVIYKVVSETPKLGSMSGRRDIKISKIMPSFDNQIPTQDREAEQLRDSFAHLATVEYHEYHSSRIRMGGLDVSTNDYFKKEGWHLATYARLVFFFFSTLETQCLSTITFRDRIFTGPDGKEYFWRLGPNNCKVRTSETCKFKQTKADLDHRSSS